MRPRSRHLQQRFFNTSCIKNRYKLKRKFYRRCFSENIWCPEKSRMPKNLSCHLKSGDLGQKYFCSFSVLFCLEKPRFIAIKILLWGWNSFLNRLVLRLVKWKVFDLRKKKLLSRRDLKLRHFNWKWLFTDNDFKKLKVQFATWEWKRKLFHTQKIVFKNTFWQASVIQVAFIDVFLKETFTNPKRKKPSPVAKWDNLSEIQHDLKSLSVIF